MKDLIDFIDYYTLDSKLYFQVPIVDTESRLEVQWTAPGLWRFKESESTFWFEVHSSDLEETLTEAGVDLEDVEKNLFNISIEHVVSASFIVQAGVEFFGEEMIETAMEQYEKFRAELSDSIDEVIEEKTKPKLSVVKPVDKKE